MKLTYTNSYLIHTNLEEAYHFLKNEYSTILNHKYATVSVIHQTYYTIIFNYAVKFNNYEEIIKITKDYFVFFLQNHKSFDANRTNTIQTFICIFLSAYKVFNKEEYIQFINENLKYKNKEIFDIDKGTFHYVSKMYELILEAYEYGFFNENTYQKYVDIWTFKPELYEKAVCISQNTLMDEYKESKNKSWNIKYKDLCF